MSPFYCNMYVLTLLTADVLRDGGAVTDMRPPLLTGDLLSSLAIK